MNVIDIIVLGIIIFSAVKAYHKGLIISLFSLCSLLLPIFLTMQLYPAGSKLIDQHTKIYESIQTSVANTLNLREQISSQTSLEEQTNIISELPLPKTIRESLLVNNNDAVYDLLQVNRLEDYISGYIARIAINILSFIIIFIIIYIGIRILIKTMNIISKLPVLNSLNKTLGLGFGVLLGLLRVWFLFVIITFFGTNQGMIKVFEMINDSTIASILYSNNYLLKVIIDLSKIII
ncbi:colicin V production protein [Natranaerovirga pectinivora]|uniref:Colicin V production protein n=1 Tax=Natranaerovirga pectinivora TaxID=682400 RepID=A0A4R3MGQ8_9FIRM|nr:CvpA family protein [Natranaerovirga pectinivora]TCT12310.1 colicin V production protein [Natranaerovirga pectinivora]